MGFNSGFNGLNIRLVSRLERTSSAPPKVGSTLVTLPRIVTPYLDSVDGTRDRVTYQKLVTR